MYQHSDLEYSLVTNGHNCNRVTTIDQCEEAAQLLGMDDVTADVLPPDVDADDRPPYCFYKTGERHVGLKFNPKGDSTTACDEIRACVCHNEGEFCHQVANCFVKRLIVIF